MSHARGIPSVTYMRVQQIGSGGGDVVQDGNNVITVLEPGNPSSRHEVAQVLPKGATDDEVCEMTIGSQAGAGIGASLNPIHALCMMQRQHWY